jgi:hypothetical protein
MNRPFLVTRHTGREATKGGSQLLLAMVVAVARSSGEVHGGTLPLRPDRRLRKERISPPKKEPMHMKRKTMALRKEQQRHEEDGSVMINLSIFRIAGPVMLAVAKASVNL